MLYIDTVTWSKFRFDENCGMYPQVKLHFSSDLGDSTLCGVSVPSNSEAEVEGHGEKAHVECKRCQKKYNEIIESELTEVAIDKKDKKPEITEEQELNWLKNNPEIGKLNDGTYYVTTEESMKEHPYYVKVELLQDVSTIK